MPKMPLVSYVGRTYGKLTVVSFGGWHVIASSGKQLTRWICSCSCGGEINSLSTNLNNGSVTHCGCRVDLTVGQRFGRLVVTGKTEPDAHGHRRYTLQCDCGRVSSATKRHLTSGARNSCGCSKRTGDSLIGAGLSLRYWRSILNNAKCRGIDVSVTPERLITLFNDQKGLCCLTGLPISLPRGRGWSREGTASVDRKDSSLGYVEGNVQWVHKEVNRLKWSMTPERLLESCREVAAAHACTLSPGEVPLTLYTGAGWRSKEPIPQLPPVDPVDSYYNELARRKRQGGSRLA